MARASGTELSRRFGTAFVTGGAGFIGSHVVRRLLEEGVAVRCLVLPDDPAPALQGLDIQRIDGDITDRRGLARAMDGADIVFNLAAIYALWLPRPEKMFEVNVGGTRAVMAAARQVGVGRVVHTSSIAAIGYLPGTEIADEASAFNDWHLSEDYVLSKYVSELEALSARRDGLEVVCTNPAFPFGSGDLGPTPTGRMVRDALYGRLPFVVKGGFNAVDVRDVAEGHLLAAMKGRDGERYILGGHNITFAEFARRIAQRVGKRPPRFVAPPKLIKAAAWVAKTTADHVTHKAPVMTPGSVAYMAGRHLWFSSAKARVELGYAPRSLDEAIDASVSWFQSQA